jgi:hypothetical protein
MATAETKRKQGNGLALTAVILGAVGAIFAFTPSAGFGIFLGVVALILGIIALRRKPAKKGRATTGTILGAAALVFGIIFASVYSGGKPAAAGSSPAAGNPAASASAPEPSKTQAPADPNAPYNATFGTFAPVTKTGTGDSVVAIPAGAKAGIVTAEHTGSSNFSLSVLDSSNQSTGDLLVNTIGAYKGVTAFGMHSLGNDGVNIKVTADGNWSVIIAPISSAPELAVPGGATGDQVYKYDGAAGNWALANQGQGNFVVAQYGGTIPNLAVNEIGAYSGTVPMTAGPSVIEIQSDGAWTVTPQ